MYGEEKNMYMLMTDEEFEAVCEKDKRREKAYFKRHPVEARLLRNCIRARQQRERRAARKVAR